MGWGIFGSKSKDATPNSEESKPKKQEFLDDLPPKFDDSNNHNQIPQRPSLSTAFSTISIQDFKIERLITIPCLREGFLTGFSAMGVMGTVLFLSTKNPRRAVNWGFGGFLLGSTIGWEQCRGVRRRSFESVELAKQVKARRMQMNREKQLKESSEEKD